NGGEVASAAFACPARDIGNVLIVELSRRLNSVKAQRDKGVTDVRGPGLVKQRVILEGRLRPQHHDARSLIERAGEALVDLSVAGPGGDKGAKLLFAQCVRQTLGGPSISVGTNNNNVGHATPPRSATLCPGVFPSCGQDTRARRQRQNFNHLFLGKERRSAA